MSIPPNAVAATPAAAPSPTSAACAIVAAVPPSSSQFLNFIKASAHVSTIGTSFPKLSFFISVRAVLTGSIACPSCACVSFNSNCALLDSSMLPDISSNRVFDSPYLSFSVCAIRSALSCVLLQVSSFALKSSSLIPAQFKASARTPVTLATWLDSFIDSVKDSIGIESPYAVQTAIAASADFDTVSVLAPIPSRFVIAFVAA